MMKNIICVLIMLMATSASAQDWTSAKTATGMSSSSTSTTSTTTQEHVSLSTIAAQQHFYMLTSMPDTMYCHDSYRQREYVGVKSSHGYWVFFDPQTNKIMQYGNLKRARCLLHPWWNTKRRSDTLRMAPVERWIYVDNYDLRDTTYSRTALRATAHHADHSADHCAAHGSTPGATSHGAMHCTALSSRR